MDGENQSRLQNIQSSKRLFYLQTNPAFLHSNSTSHEWVFGAFAELIDNAYDPDVAASQMYIDVYYKNNDDPYVTFSDNGAGMNVDQLHRMLSFGFSCKQTMPASGRGQHHAIGRYGNGFKSGSMRIGRDALVLTRRSDRFTCGLLSQTYLKAIDTDTVLVPMVSWGVTMRSTNLITSLGKEDNKDALREILAHSLYTQMSDLRVEMEDMVECGHTTRVYIYNLKRNADKLELDFENDPSDIRFLEHVEYGINQQQIRDHQPEYRKSLRSYCSILYLKPRMQIFIRGKKVKTKNIAKCLSRTECDTYQPRFLQKAIKIVFGFTNHKEDYGMMLYHRNRLIEAFVRVGYQKQANILGVGVIGVVEANFLEVSHNKQSFCNDPRYLSTIKTLGQKMNDYWDEKKNTGLIGDGVESIDVEDDNRTAPDWTWVQCDNPQCLKWRRLPENYRSDALPDKWFCYMNPDPQMNTCFIEEEAEDSSISAPYQKVYKKQSRIKATRGLDSQPSGSHSSTNKDGVVLKQEVNGGSSEVVEELEKERKLLLEKMEVQDSVLREQERKLALLQKEEQLRNQPHPRPTSASTSSSSNDAPLSKQRRVGAPTNNLMPNRPSQNNLSFRFTTPSRMSSPRVPRPPTYPRLSPPSSSLLKHRVPAPSSSSWSSKQAPTLSSQSTSKNAEENVRNEIEEILEIGENESNGIDGVIGIDSVITLDSDDDENNDVVGGVEQHIKTECDEGDVKMRLISPERLNKLETSSRQAEDAIMLLGATEKQLDMCRRKLKEARLFVIGLQDDISPTDTGLKRKIDRLLRILN